MGDKRPQRLVSRTIEVEEQPKKKQKAEDEKSKEEKAMPFGIGNQLVNGGNFHYQAFELDGTIFYRGYYVKVVPKDKHEECYVAFIKGKRDAHAVEYSAVELESSIMEISPIDQLGSQCRTTWPSPPQTSPPRPSASSSVVLLPL